VATRISSVFAVLAVTILLSPDCGSAGDKAQPDVPVAYGVLIDGKEPVYGQQVCHIHSRCQLVDDQKTHVEVSVTIESTQRLSGEISIQCSEPDCSFLNGRTSARLESAAGGERARRFELYAGEDASFTNDLVYRTRASIGRILILF
jgi:hypothetical protein